jgi:hypothetical protein
MATPKELPALTYMQSASFDIHRYSEYGDGGGLGQTMEPFDPEWRASFRFAGFPTRADRDVWHSFLRSLRGAKIPVLVFDPARRVPLEHYDGEGKPLASGSPWGAPNVADYDRAASTFDLEGWTAGQQLRAGDYFSFQDTSDRWHLHVLTADAQADGSGDVTVTVEPRPARGLTHGDATLRVRDACCQAMVSWNPQDFQYGGNNASPFSIAFSERVRDFI